MGIYSKYVFPYVLEWSLGTPEMGEYRRRALETVRGETLEVGFGTGLNLPYYPQSVTKLTAIDSEDLLRRKVESRITKSRFPVTRIQLDAGGCLPFQNYTFDSVVTTLTLCSIRNVEAALAEIRRVLKPDGRLSFFEHGRSNEPVVARRQDLFNPIQRIIGAGCNLNRPIDRLIRSAGFEIEDLERFSMPGAPRVLAEMYRGVAFMK